MWLLSSLSMKFCSELGAPKGTQFIETACGRNHTLLIGSDGSLWTAGANNLGQCGHTICPEISEFQPVSVTHGGKKERVVKASAGITFSIVLSESGKGHSLCPFLLKWPKRPFRLLYHLLTGVHHLLHRYTSSLLFQYYCYFPLSFIYVYIFIWFPSTNSQSFLRTRLRVSIYIPTVILLLTYTISRLTYLQ